MKKTISLEDVIKIAPTSGLLNLSKTDKHKLMDAALEVNDEKKRGLNVKFQLSAAGKRINNRIYTPKGQQDGLNSWLEPFAKPIILNHDMKSDPLGRFTDVQYIPNRHSAVKYFKNLHDYQTVYDSCEGNNKQKMYDALHNYNLLDNRSWPGVGTLVANAKITDSDAIEKFLDGRYLTFSSGAHTDSFVCSHCGMDWINEDMCEHEPGEVIDGKPVVFLTGTYLGREASVLNNPANSTSTVIAMDSDETPDIVLTDKFKVEEPNYLLTDVDLSVPMILEDAKQPDSAVPIMEEMLGHLLAQYLLYYQCHWKTQGPMYYADHLLFARLYDGIESELDSLAEKIIGYNGQKAIDMANLTQIAHDKVKKWTADPDLRMQGLASERSMQLLFRNSYDKLKSMEGGMPLGLDDYVMATASAHDTHEYLLQQRLSMEPAEMEPKMQTNDSEETEVVKEIETTDQVETELVVTEDAVQDESTTEEKEIVIDWQLFELALETEVRKTVDSEELENVLLTDEKKASLGDEYFCTKDRELAIPNKEYLAAAQKLFENSKALTQEAKDHLAIMLIEKKKTIESDTKDSDLRDLQKDFKEALKTIKSLKDEIESLKSLVKTNDEQVESVEENKKSETVVEDSSNISYDMNQIENPSSTGGKVNLKTEKSLSDYQQLIVKRYKELKDTGGQVVADRYIESKKIARVIPKNFDPTLHMES